VSLAPSGFANLEKGTPEEPTTVLPLIYNLTLLLCLSRHLSSHVSSHLSRRFPISLNLNPEEKNLCLAVFDFLRRFGYNNNEITIGYKIGFYHYAGN
jgi:hypothetical protein